VFGPLKAAYREKVEQLYRGGANTVGKEHFTSLYSPARETAITPRNIKAGWVKAGLYPFNPDKVLRDIQKPLAELTIRKPDKVKFNLQDEVLQTPVTAEHVIALHNLIEQDAGSLDETSKNRLQKLANAAKLSTAEYALLQDENEFLFIQKPIDQVKSSGESESDEL
jgi:hypothetical protein